MSDESSAAAEPPAEDRPLQFSLRLLLLLPVGLALFLGIGLWLHWSVAVVLATMVLSIGGKIYGRWTWVEFVGVTAIGLLLAGLMLGPVLSAPSGGRRVQCANNLHQVAIGLHNYHAAHGCFPPAVLTDAQGRPMHSWRVLILPYMEYKPLYEQYRLDEPWDGPNNRKLHGTAVAEFVCPWERKVAATNTWYLAVAGPGTAWRKNRGVSLRSFTDGTSKTILVVEVADSGIHWMEPRDLDVQKMAPGINSKSGQGISSFHSGIVNVLFADGTVHCMSENLPPADIQALLTIAGGEKVDPAAW